MERLAAGVCHAFAARCGTDRPAARLGRESMPPSRTSILQARLSKDPAPGDATMSPAAPPLGVAAPPPLPPPAAPAMAVPPPAAPVALPATPDAFRLAWPSAAQAAVAFLGVLTLGLLGWHAYARSRWATRPAALAPGDAEVFRIDLNRADAVTLMPLPGCGEALAGRIVAYREQYGPFRSLSDLRNVQGVGPSLLERWRDRVYLSRPDGAEDGEPERKDDHPVTQNPPRTAGPPRPAVG